jgi:hypothetical protein
MRAMPTGTAGEQLAAIASLAAALDAAEIDHWLFGGWAVDLWAGAVTRDHDDVDIAAWRSDADRIRIALTDAGWRHAPEPTDVAETRYRLGDVLLEVTFVELDELGRVVIPFADGPAVWSSEPFGSDRPALGDVSCRAMSLQLLRDGKATPRPDADDAAKDRADHAVLRRIQG